MNSINNNTTFNDWINIMSDPARLSYVEQQAAAIQAQVKTRLGVNAKHTSKDKMKILEDLLNIKRVQGVGAPTFIQELHAAQMDTLDFVFNNVAKRWEKKGGSNPNNLFTPLLKPTSESKQGVTKKTLDTLLEEISNYLNTLDTIQPNANIAEKVNEAKGYAKEALKCLERIRDDYLRSIKDPSAIRNDTEFTTRDVSTSFGRPVYKISKEANEFINSLQFLTGIQTTLKRNSDSTVPTNKNFGDAFEIVLADFFTKASEKLPPEIVQQLLDELENSFGTKNITGAKTGQVTTKETQKIINVSGLGITEKDGKIIDNSMTGLNKVKYLQDTKDQNGDPVQRIFTIKDNMKIDVNKDRQGKMDAQWILGDPINGELRISAKNWSHLSGHDLGDTSIMAAIARTTNELSLINYEFGLQWEVPQRSFFHEFAKLCLVVDVAMGFSQTTAYANVLIVYDRSADHVYVRSMSDLLEMFMNCLQLFNTVTKSNNKSNNSNPFNLSDYVDNDINAIAQAIRSMVYREETEDELTESKRLYVGYMHQILNQIRIKINIASQAFATMYDN